MIATKRPDGTYVLGDSHGDLVDDRVEPSRAWCGDGRKPESVMRAMYRRRAVKRAMEEGRR